MYHILLASTSAPVKCWPGSVTQPVWASVFDVGCGLQAEGGRQRALLHECIYAAYIFIYVPQVQQERAAHFDVQTDIKLSAGRLAGIAAVEGCAAT